MIVVAGYDERTSIHVRSVRFSCQAINNIWSMATFFPASDEMLHNVFMTGALSFVLSEM